MTEGFKRCVNCRERIELINFALGPEWRHWPTPDGNYQVSELYRYCRTVALVATPERVNRSQRSAASERKSTIRHQDDGVRLLGESMLDREWREAIEGFLANERTGGKRSSTNAARRQHLEHLARRVTVGPWRVTSDILLDYLGERDWATETRRGRRTTFLRFYAWGIYRGFVTLNPADAAPKIKMDKGRARPAPDRVYHEALIAARPRERLMLRLAAELGMRRAEVAQAHTQDIMEDLVGRSLIVHGKGGKTRIVPLPVSLGRTLADLPAGFMFPGDDRGHLSPRYVGKLIRDLLPGEWTMHTLRHRFGTRAYALTSDLLLVQEMLGHASPTTTRRYVEYDRARMRAAVEELAS